MTTVVKTQIIQQPSRKCYITVDFQKNLSCQILVELVCTTMVKFCAITYYYFIFKDR